MKGMITRHRTNILLCPHCIMVLCLCVPLHTTDAQLVDETQGRDGADDIRNANREALASELRSLLSSERFADRREGLDLLEQLTYKQLPMGRQVIASISATDVQKAATASLTKAILLLRGNSSKAIRNEPLWKETYDAAIGQIEVQSSLLVACGVRELLCIDPKTGRCVLAVPTEVRAYWDVSDSFLVHAAAKTEKSKSGLQLIHLESKKETLLRPGPVDGPMRLADSEGNGPTIVFFRNNVLQRVMGDGATVWEQKLTCDTILDMAGGEDGIAVITSEGSLRFLNAADGALLWTVEDLNDDKLFLGLDVSNDLVIVRTWKRFAAYRKKDGAQAWEHRLKLQGPQKALLEYAITHVQERRLGNAYFRRPFSIDEGILYFEAYDSIVALSIGTGQIAWEYVVPIEKDRSREEAPGGLMREGLLWSVVTLGNVAWLYPKEDYSLLSPMTVYNGKLIVGIPDGIIAVSLKSKEEIWSVLLDAPVQVEPVVGTGNEVFVAYRKIDDDSGREDQGDEIQYIYCFRMPQHEGDRGK